MLKNKYKILNFYYCDVYEDYIFSIITSNKLKYKFFKGRCSMEIEISRLTISSFFSLVAFLL